MYQYASIEAPAKEQGLGLRQGIGGYKYEFPGEGGSVDYDTDQLRSMHQYQHQPPPSGGGGGGGGGGYSHLQGHHHHHDR